MMFHKQSLGGARSNNHSNQLVIKQLPCLLSAREEAYIFTLSTHLTFLDSFQHPSTTPTPHSWLILHSQEYGRSTLGSGRIPSPEPSPRTARQIRIILSDLFVSVNS